MSSADPRQIAFLGLGVMGYPMAGHLARAGYAVTVYNRTRSRADDWLQTHADAAPAAVTVADTPIEAARNADVVLMCVGNDDDVRSVCLGEQGALAAMAAGTLLIDHTTASPRLAQQVGSAAVAAGVGFLDAPVSGGQAGAENGALTIMAGGSDEDFERATGVFEKYAHKYSLMGAVGAGQLTKIVNQVCIAGVLQGLAEGVHFAQQAGLDVERVVEVISKGAAQSWQMDNRAGTMARDQFEFGFAADWMRKDLGIALDTARQVGARLPLTALVDQFYGDIQQMGGGRWDTSSLLRRLTPTDNSSR